MKTDRIDKRNRDLGKLALVGLRLVLAIVFCLLGVGFLLSPWISGELDRAGIGSSFRLILAVTHVVGGLSLLVPRLAREAALALSLFVAGSALYLHGEGVGIKAAVPVLLILGLLVYGLCLQVHRRVAATLWSEMLGRYADQQDALRSENA